MVATDKSLRIPEVYLKLNLEQEKENLATENDHEDENEIYELFAWHSLKSILERQSIQTAAKTRHYQTTLPP